MVQWVYLRHRCRVGDRDFSDRKPHRGARCGWLFARSPCRECGWELPLRDGARGQRRVPIQRRHPFNRFRALLLACYPLRGRGPRRPASLRWRPSTCGRELESLREHTGEFSNIRRWEVTCTPANASHGPVPSKYRHLSFRQGTTSDELQFTYLFADPSLCA